MLFAILNYLLSGLHFHVAPKEVWVYTEDRQSVELTNIPIHFS